ncbi:NUDIX hydrolase [Corynebacterium pseudotuberculosis]|uniref:NUDIX domain-containing protein n=2 Tax=Corynebacterium pseudotuberculosis TaxID=1719 RepID=D9Q9L4_CORP2|nr:NUDIX domain-containing protein [Corynebacterium pseudotuberculosis]ADK28552.1 NUDIX domain-containing protein [Corynebacterium pseudotuberculosis FRC41]ADL10240.1 NUDIX domain-containing protein [Corynebacterium pseudotuberculosis C231]ADL20649.1 NUDIX domain-containing protein [Corynebacterium pseudotuberculosis 1002]ADO26032.1 NUDIX domain-containing protein [Corynebacterium pseudotuberculosis I19]AEK92089.1 MutT-like protein [Corynebacterium pseudotuberculosis PAT10]
MIIRIAAVVFFKDGKIASVRKRGTDSFMLPGGKLEEGEAPISAAIREIAEELQIRMRVEELEAIGRYQAPAANEPGAIVDCDVFLYRGDEKPNTVYEEIEEIAWFGLDSDSERLAPLSRDVVFPALRG